MGAVESSTLGRPREDEEEPREERDLDAEASRLRRTISSDCATWSGTRHLDVGSVGVDEEAGACAERKSESSFAALRSLVGADRRTCGNSILCPPRVVLS